MFNYNYIINEFDCKDIKIMERFSSFEVKCRSSKKIIKAKNIINELNNIPIEDNAKINIEYGEYNLEINKKTKEGDINNFFESLNLIDDDLYDIDLEIRKSKDNVNIYSVSSFLSWLNELTIFGIIKAFNSAVSDYEILNINFISNIHKTNYYNKKTEYIRKSKLINCITATDISNFKLLPYDFDQLINMDIDNKDLEKKLKFIKNILSIAYISNECYLYEDKFCFTLFNLDKYNKEIKYSDYRFLDLKNYDDIFDWLYEGGNINDKVEIVRNILILHLNNASSLTIEENILETIISNYRLYLKDNVKDYLQFKKDVTKALEDFCKQVADIINNYIGSYKANFITTIGYIITILFSKGITSGTETIFTKDISILSSFVIVISLIFCFISCLQVCSNMSYYNQAIEQLKSNFKDIMTDQEIEQMISNNKLLQKAKGNFKKSTFIISIAWIITCIILFLVLDYLSGDVKLLFFINLFK